MNRIFRRIARAHCLEGTGGIGAGGNGAAGIGGGTAGGGGLGGDGDGDSANGGLGPGFGGLGGLAGFSGTGPGLGGMAGGGDISGPSGLGMFGGFGGVDSTYGGMNAPTGGFSPGLASLGGWAGSLAGEYGGGGYGDYAGLGSAFSSTAPGQLGAANPYAGRADFFGLSDEARAVDLANRVEAQIALSNLAPTMRQKVQSAIFGGQLTPSLDALAGVINQGATQTDIVRGYNSGNLTSNEQGDVTADPVGTTLSMISPLSAIFSPVKMGLALAMGAPMDRAIGLPGPLGLVSLARNAYGAYGDISAASRALGNVASQGQASPSVSPGMAFAANANTTATPTAGGTGIPTAGYAGTPTVGNLASLSTGSPSSGGGLYGLGLGMWGRYAPRMFG